MPPPELRPGAPSGRPLGTTSLFLWLGWGSEHFQEVVPVVEAGVVEAAGALAVLSLVPEAGLLSFAPLPESDLDSDLESDFESDLDSESPPDEPLLAA